MVRNDEFDADEVLRDVGDDFEHDTLFDEDDEEMQELEFGTAKDERTHFHELTSDLDNAEELWN